MSYKTKARLISRLWKVYRQLVLDYGPRFYDPAIARWMVVVAGLKLPRIPSPVMKPDRVSILRVNASEANI